MRRSLSILFLVAAISLTGGCAALIESALGGRESCEDTCHDNYESCVDTMGTPDANHYCLSRRNQCVADC